MVWKQLAEVEKFLLHRHLQKALFISRPIETSRYCRQNRVSDRTGAENLISVVSIKSITAAAVGVKRLHLTGIAVH